MCAAHTTYYSILRMSMQYAFKNTKLWTNKMVNRSYIPRRLYNLKYYNIICDSILSYFLDQFGVGELLLSLSFIHG